MAFRISHEIERGEIDNRRHGVVTGRIWFAGKDEPVVLDLIGNCHRDVAGCFLSFHNPDPIPNRGPTPELAGKQEGHVGDITASRKVRVLEGSLEDALELSREGKSPPTRWGNCLYIEWYSQTDGRVVIESPDFEIRISPPEWTMDEKEDTALSEQALAAFEDFLSKAAYLTGQQTDTMEIPNDREMNEFEWEKFLRHNDDRAERFAELLDKFRDHPQRDRIIARHMGWDWLADALERENADPTNRVFADREKRDTPDSADDMPDWDSLLEMEPNPATEGINWVDDDEHGIIHPMALAATQLSEMLFYAATASGLWTEKGPRNDDVDDLVFNVQTMAAKLAGALNGLAYSETIEPGFVVACLKRALPHLNDALEAFGKVEQQNLMPEHLPALRKDLFALRSGITDMMERFRRMHQ